MTELRSVAVTTGEPAGIGPEVSLKAAAAVSDPILLIGDRTLLEAEARRLGIAWPLPAPRLHPSRAASGACRTRQA